MKILNPTKETQEYADVIECSYCAKSQYVMKSKTIKAICITCGEGLCEVHIENHIKREHNES